MSHCPHRDRRHGLSLKLPKASFPKGSAVPLGKVHTLTALALALAEQTMQPQGLLGENWNGESQAQCAGRVSQGGQSTVHVASVQDCLQRIGNFLWTHYSIASTLTCTSLALTVAISSFLGLLLSRPTLLLPRQKQSWVTASNRPSLIMALPGSSRPSQQGGASP